MQLMNEQKFDYFRRQLENMKKTIEIRLKENGHFNLEAGFGHESIGELSSYDNHPGDDGTELYEREKDLALNKHLEKEYEEVNSALQRIKDGTYGICTVCGKAIDENRLKAIPTAATCEEHAVEQPIRHERPIEEEVLNPFFGTFDTDQENIAITDPFDYFHDVFQYGTSESPQDFSNPIDSYQDINKSDDEPGFIEDFENFIGTDIEGKNIEIYPFNEQHRRYEEMLDLADYMVLWGDLPPREKDPYTEKEKDLR
mgnify:CR=1 FL=1